MCTLVFSPTSNDMFIIGMNRDEQGSRPTSFFNLDNFADKNYLYPIDTQAGGTWIAADKSSRVLVLLNNYTAKTQINNSSKKYVSRGNVIPLILDELKVFSVESISEFLSKQLQHFQPFRLVFIDASIKNFVEFVSDGENLKTFSHQWNPTILSSSSLLEKEAHDSRKKLFLNFFKDQAFSLETVLDFLSLQPEQNPELAYKNIYIVRPLVQTDSQVIISYKSRTDFDFYYHNKAGFKFSVSK